MTRSDQRLAAAVAALTVGVGAFLPHAGAAVEAERYAVIVARKPFGSPPAVMAASPKPIEAPILKPEPLFLNDFVMCMLRESNFGARVGLKHKKTKRSYYLGVGQSTDDGVSVLAIDFEFERVLLKKDDVEGWLSLDGTTRRAESGEVARKTRPKDIAPAPAAVTPPATPTPRPPAKTGLTKEELARTRHERLQPMSAARHKFLAENPGVTLRKGKELEESLREYNLKLIRAGGSMGPALPITLTPEEDAMLVREGVLPALPE